MRQNVLIWGASGNVGRALIDQIAEKDQTTHRNPTDIIGIADSEHAIVSDKALDQRVLREVARTRDGIKGYLAANKAKYSDPRELVDMVRKVGRDGEVIVVDVTTVGESAKDFHLDVLDRSSNKVATANKNPVSLYSMADFNGLTRHHGRYNYDATVMAGKGAIDFAIRSRELNDSVNEIEGMLSGTLGFVFSELAKGEKSFSEIVREAKEKGYTEPNPFHDLNGVDVARKLTILARSAGYDVDLKRDVKVESLLDDKFANLKGDEFWAELEKENGRFAEMANEARTEGKVVRYTAKMVRDGNGISLKVGPGLHGPESPFYAMNGTYNKVVFKTDILRNGHIIESPGAGLDVTAASVRDAIRRMMPADALRM